MAQTIIDAKNPIDDQQKSGYLRENYRLFHITDQSDRTYTYHFHDFNKVILLLSGHITYYIEGKEYHPKPGDYLLVRHHALHRPVIDPGEPYERIVLWTRPGYLNQPLGSQWNLGECFRKTIDSGLCLLRPHSSSSARLRGQLMTLESALDSDSFGADLLAQTSFLQFFIYLNQTMDSIYENHGSDVTYNPMIDQVLQYINNHVTEAISNDSIAEEFFLNKYYLMHKFKEETGYTIHQYLLQKRLALAAAEIKNGLPVIKASEASGFSDYSTFLRAFRKFYNCSPGDLRNLDIPTREFSD